MSACASRKLLQQGVGQRSGVVMADHPAGFFQGTEMPTAGWWEALWPDPAGVLAAVGLRPGTDVIDLCSGDGWFTFQIAKVARHVTAIDIDPHLLEVARHRLVESGVANCIFIAGDAYDLAQLNAPADFIFMANAFHGVPDRARLAQAVKKCTESGWKLCNCKLAQASARGNTHTRGTPRAKNRIENVTRGNDKIS
jgi:SAM-dependent methyltransferase